MQKYFSLVDFGIYVSEVASWNTEQLVKFEFQINNKFLV